ncbi:glycine-rich cell wall structural protein 1.8-like [Rosa chinensis]|uniref:glycine-rich cell wall structural protein 1.8-like n=1 Tax=Rosa chinensis TaxID=74649 RepID=UPI000D095248|nr:glycine-rich cell wall structural protein 1.8-like [Rosa chinensis]
MGLGIGPMGTAATGRGEEEGGGIDTGGESGASEEEVGGSGRTSSLARGWVGRQRELVRREGGGGGDEGGGEGDGGCGEGGGVGGGEETGSEGEGEDTEEEGEGDEVKGGLGREKDKSTLDVGVDGSGGKGIGPGWWPNDETIELD